MALSLILAGYMVAGLFYLLATPPLEASDEKSHFPVIHYLQTARTLPILRPGEPGRWRQEGAQPPLYYLLMAGLTAWIDTGDLPEIYDVNPHAFIGDPNQVGNKNLIIPDPNAGRFPGSGSIRAIYLIRAFSLFLGAGTLLIIARLGSRLFDEKVGLFAAALTAFNPMFLFVHAAVNNDSLAILLGHLVLLLLVRLWQESPLPAERWGNYAGLGIVLGLGILTKLSLLALLGLTLVALAWLALRKRQPALLLEGGALVAAFSMLPVAWWFARNMVVYGDPTALAAFVGIQEKREAPLTLAGWWREFGTFYRSFWGLFGAVNISAPDPFYKAYNALALVGLGGLFWRGLRGRRPFAWVESGAWLLPAWTAILFLALIRWNLILIAFQGRLLFPALGAINLLLAVGLFAWVGASRRAPRAVSLSVIAWLGALALALFVIRPAYRLPRPVASVPASARLDPIRFSDGAGAIQLAGAQMPPGQVARPGENAVEVILFWQAIEPVSGDYVSSIHLFAPGGESVGQVDRYPASGMIPTSRWEAGQIWRDRYLVRVRDAPSAAGQLQVWAGLYDPVAARPLAGEGATVGHVPFVPDSSP